MYFLGGSLWSSGLHPGLCSKEADVWEQREQEHRPPVRSASLSVKPLTSVCTSVITGWIFTAVNSHQGALSHCRVLTLEFWYELYCYARRPALHSNVCLSQEINTVQQYQKKVSHFSRGWNPVEGWRGETSHGCNVRSLSFNPLHEVQCVTVTWATSTLFNWT